MKKYDALKVGKAYAAFTAYNHKAKVDRIKEFILERWIRVVEILEGKPKRQSSGWSEKRRAKFEKTMIARKKLKIVSGRWNKVRLNGPLATKAKAKSIKTSDLLK